MKNTLLGLGCMLAALVGISVCLARAPDKAPPPRKQEKKEEASIWMKRKLEYSRKILEGLTRGDFDLVKTSAAALEVVSYLEESDRADLPGYRRQLRYFTDANKELIRQCRNRNSSGATLAYTQMTLSCVHCHDLIRDAKKK
jgi:hypothetical protein